MSRWFRMASSLRHQRAVSSHVQWSSKLPRLRVERLCSWDIYKGSWLVSFSCKWFISKRCEARPFWALAWQKPRVIMAWQRVMLLSMKRVSRLRHRFDFKFHHLLDFVLGMQGWHCWYTLLHVSFIPTETFPSFFWQERRRTWITPWPSGRWLQFSFLSCGKWLAHVLWPAAFVRLRLAGFLSSIS